MQFYKLKGSISEKGFSYIEVMIAMTIMLVGVVALASALTANLLRSFESEHRIIAKQIALSTVESIISARDIKRTGVIEGWDSIGNVNKNPVNGVPRGIFLNGWGPIREELGWDGVAGTADDACPETDICDVEGRPTNTSPVIKGFQRQITITDVEDPERPSPPVSRRRIEVKVKFFANQAVREETVTTLVANY